MKSFEAIAQLRAELRQDREFIHQNYQKNQRMHERLSRTPAPDEFDFAALSYTLHNLYNSFESYFYRIAKFFENTLDPVEWHKDLVERMTLSIEGIRPALFNHEFALRIEELRKFRHVFRNLYKTPLVPEKVLFVQKIAASLDEEFQPFHDAFDRFLADLERAMQMD